MSILNGGVFTKYFSNNVLNSFTISSSIIIVVSQIETLLGISIKDENIPFELVDVS
jgi:MFS superfamily sulfate permease-like transporter